MTLLPEFPWPVFIGLSVLLVGFVVWRLIAAGGQRVHWIRRLLMVVLVIAMMARPGVPGGEVPTGSLGINVFLAIDTTQSMAAEDWGDEGATRLDGVVEDVETIVHAFAGSDVAVVTFDSTAQLRVPLTDDATAVVHMARALNPELGSLSRGSSVTLAHDQLLTLLQEAEAESPERPNIVFYLGDGEQTSATAPVDMSDLAQYIDGGAVLGYGTEAGAPMQISTISADAEPEYVQDPSTGQDAISHLDPAMLGQIAAQLGVSYIQRAPALPLSDLLDGMQAGATLDIDRTEEARLEIHWVFAIPLFLLMLWEAVVLLRALRPGVARRQRARRVPDTTAKGAS